MNNIKTIALYAGGLLLLVGACLMVSRWSFVPWLYTAGAVLFAIGQLWNEPQSGDFVMKRLRGQLTLASLLFVAAGVLMFFTSHNEWMLCFSAAVVFEVYAVFRISAEQKKEEGKSENS